MTKKSELSFIDGFTCTRGAEARAKGAKFKSFNWNKAAMLIKEALVLYPNLTAEAGLQADWSCTGGVIFEDGKPTNDHYTYLQSNWAIPTLIIEVDGEEISETPCYEEEGKYNEGSKWNDESLKILGLEL